MVARLSTPITTTWESICWANSAHVGAVFRLFITIIIGLLLGWGLNKRIIGQGYLIWIPKHRRLRVIDGIHGYHPTFRKLEPPSLEDDRTHQIIGVFKPHVVENLLAHLYGLLQVGDLLVMDNDNAFGLSKFDLSLPEFALQVLHLLLS